MIIGYFAEEKGEFSGEIRTMTLTMRVVLKATAAGRTDIGPTHKAFTGDIEIGAAWERLEDGKRFYRVRLDDPAFAAPMDGTLISGIDGGWALEWYRPGTSRYVKAA